MASSTAHPFTVTTETTWSFPNVIKSFWVYASTEHELDTVLTSFLVRRLSSVIKVSIIITDKLRWE